MKNAFVKKLISMLVIVCHTGLVSLVPMASARAVTICDAANPTTAAGGTSGCAVKLFPTGAYAYPKLDWQPYGTASFAAENRSSLATASGNKAKVDNNRGAATLGLEGKKMSDVVSLFPANVPFVFARYNPMSFELEIDLFKVERTGGQTVMMHAPYTPSHGGAYAAALTYASLADKQMGLAPGANPFALFETPGSDGFHNVATLGAVQTAVGHAMRSTGASIGLVAVATLRPEQWTTTSGGWFRKTTTQHLRGWAKPDWYVATPQSFQTHGTSAQTCAITVTDPTLCPPQLVVKSGVAWTQWTGGNLPVYESVVSNWTHDESGFTLLAMVVFVFIAALIAGPLAAELGASAGAAGPITGLLTAGEGVTFAQGLALTELGATAGTDFVLLSTTFAPLEAAATEAAFAGGVGLLSGAGPLDVVNGPYQGAASGFGAPTTPSSEASQSLYDGLKTEFDTPDLNGTGVVAVRDGAYGAGCAPGANVAACGGSSGTVPRPDSGIILKGSQIWSDNGAPAR